MAVKTITYDIDLLLKSKEIEGYPKLKEFCKLHQGKAPEEIKNAFITADTDIRIMFENKIYAKIVSNASKEWKFKNCANNPIILEKVDKNKKCQYCGEAGLRNIYFVENIFNGCVLEVGRDCIDAFEACDKKDIEKQTKKSEESFRIYQLNKEINGVIEIINKIFDPINKCKLLLPECVSSELNENSNKIHSLYNEYINEKTLKKLPMIAVQMKTLLIERNNYIEKLDKYINSVKSNPLVAYKEYEKDLKDDTEAIKQMKSTGLVGKLAIRKITNHQFLKKQIPSLNNFLETIETEIIEEYKEGYWFKTKNRNEKFYIKFYNLMSVCAEVLFNEPINKISTIEILTESEIDDLDSLIISIQWLLNDTAYDFEMYYSFNEIVFFSKFNPPKHYITSHESENLSPNDAILHSLKDFYNRFKIQIVTRKKLDKKRLVEYIYSGNRIVFAEHNKSRDI